MAKPAVSNYPMDTGYSWLVLLCSFLISFIILGQILNFGIYYVVFLDYFDSTRKSTSLIGAICYALNCSIGPISGVLQKRYGAQIVITLGATLSTIGLILSYFATEIWHLYLTYGCLCGIGYGLCTTPSLAILPEYFEKYKYFVTSFAVIGSSLGSFIFSPLSLYLIDTYTWRGSMLIQAGLSFQNVIFGFICKSRRIQHDANLVNLFDLALLKNRCFILFMTDGIVLGGASFTVFSMINSLIISRGLTTWQSAKLVSICGLSTVIARILASIISPMKCTDRLVLYSIMSLAGATGAIGCVFCYDFVSFAMALAIFGFSLGIKFSQPANVIIDLFGVDKVLTGLGYFMFAVGFGGFVLPLISGWIADQTDTQNAFILTSVNCLIGFGFCCILLFIRKKQPKGDDADRVENEKFIEIRKMSRALSIN